MKQILHFFFLLALIAPLAPLAPLPAQSQNEVSQSVALQTVAPRAVLAYYGEIGCAHCDLFMEKVLPAAEKAAGVRADASLFDILSADGFKRCEEELALRGHSFTVFPVLIIGNNVYQGNAAIDENLLPELSFFAKGGTYRDMQKPAGIPHTPFSLAFFPVLLAGLVDGINPCAFATMLFFMSWIALRGGGRRRMLASGIAFIAGVFFAYLGIGFGLFSIFRTASGLEWVRIGVRYLFASLSLLFALLSLWDAVAIRRGRAADMMLQLPSGLKLLVHRAIRSTASTDRPFSLTISLSFFVTGSVVAFLELACTGQIYFPAIAYMLQSGGAKSQVLWLFLYNTAFIVPLGCVLALCLAGVEQTNIREWFSRNLFISKLLIALFFMLLAILVWGGK